MLLKFSVIDGDASDMLSASVAAYMPDEAVATRIAVIMRLMIFMALLTDFMVMMQSYSSQSQNFRKYKFYVDYSNYYCSYLQNYNNFE